MGSSVGSSVGDERGVDMGLFTADGIAVGGSVGFSVAITVGSTPLGNIVGLAEGRAVAAPAEEVPVPVSLDPLFNRVSLTSSISIVTSVGPEA